MPKVLALAARSAKAAGVGAVAYGRWLAEVALEVAEHRATGRATVVARAWAEGRGVRADELLHGGLGGAARRQARRQLTALLRRRLLLRDGRDIFSLAPLLAGAAVGGELNRRATRDLGAKVSASLRLI